MGILNRLKTYIKNDFMPAMERAASDAQERKRHRERHLEYYNVSDKQLNGYFSRKRIRELQKMILKHNPHPDEISKEKARPEPRRRTISERVRNEVWRRDQGKCVDCGSRVRLEYDHIIPVSKGGSSTARNIELRCETCNRQKGARI